MPFTLTPGVHPDYDEEHRVRGLEHTWEPFYPPSGSAISSARALAAEYLRQAASIYGSTRRRSKSSSLLWRTSLGST